MSRSARRSTLIFSIYVLSAILLLLLGLTVYLTIQRNQIPPATVPVQSDVPATAAPQQTTSPTEVTEATTVPTEPKPRHYTLSFAGDCTLGNRKGKAGQSTFIGTVGENYAHPFADVQEYFANDDCTFVNLENPLTDGGTPDAKKEFVFKGPTSYVNILTQGSVEFANVVNNHTLDYGETGYRDTLSTLDGAGIRYAEKKNTVVFTTESGLTIGVYADLDPQNTKNIAAAIKQLRDDGAEVVIVALHWGYEYYYKHNATQQKIARHAIDSGADIVYGHHPHVLQKIEQYRDGYIFYSLGNFSFGGNPNPPDKDTAILQMQIVREVDGSVHLGELTIIPCFVSGAGNVGNDYQPCPMDPEADADAYQRVLKKLDGSFHLQKLVVSYREDLNPTDPTEGTTDGNAPTDGGEAPDNTETPGTGETSGSEEPSGGETAGSQEAPSNSEDAPEGNDTGSET